MRTSSQATRRQDRDVSFGTLAFCVVVIAVCVVALRHWHDQRVVIDDAYISFRYARNLLRGAGLVFNPGERVEGYTNFLWVLLSCVPIALHLDPFVAMRNLGLAAYVAWILLASTGFLATRGRSTKTVWLVAAAALPVVALPDGLASFAGSGMETHFVGLCLLAFGLTQHVWRPETRRRQLLVAAIPLAACLTRLDAIVFVGASVVVVAAGALVERESLRAVARDLAVRYGVTAAGLAVWFSWKVLYYGAWLPNTYYAKSGDANHWDVGVLYLRAFLDGSPYIIALAPFVILSASSLADRGARSFGRFAIVGLAAYTTYVAKVGGDFMHYRFMFEVFPVFAWSAFAGLSVVASRSLPTAIASALCATWLTGHAPVMEGQFHQETMEEMNNCCGPPFVDLGKRLAAVLPRGVVIATTAAGSIPYFADTTAIDQLGLTDAFVAHGPEFGAFRRGHVKRAPETYLAARGVTLVIGHPVLCDCDKPCVEPGKANVFVRMGAQCVRSEYLEKTPRLTEFFCGHPDDFLVTGLTCPAPAARAAAKAD
jgi:arabinofuranosyltransferase